MVAAVIIFLSNTPRHFSAKENNASTQIASSVVSYVNKYYIDKTKIDPHLMLSKGLSQLEKIIDEVLIEFNENPENKTFIVQVLDNKQSFDYSNINKIGDIPELLDSVFGYISAYYQPEGKTFQDIEYAVLDEMLKTLDANSGIITPKIYKEFMIETEGSFGGLGIVIGIREGQLTVISPIEGTPAFNAGIKSKDRIVQIEDGSTINMSLLEAVSKLRGPKGTRVNIYVMRDSFTAPKKFTIKRDTIKIESVDAFALEDNVIYLKVRDFQKNTHSSIQEKLNALTDGDINSAQGIILDLRGNPGGLLEQSKMISDLFLQSGDIVSTQIGDDKQTYSADDEYYEYRGKMVVLVDSGSASASEIVAGALKNNHRALVMGDQTFGKGSVQQIFSLKDNAALKLTIAKYLTPGDISIQDIGITPDIALHPVTADKELIDIIPGTDKHKKNHNNSNNTKIEPPKDSINYVDMTSLHKSEEEQILEEAMNKEQKLEKIKEDFAVSLSANIIKNAKDPKSINNVDLIKEQLAKYRVEQEHELALKLKELNIDWFSSINPNGKDSITINITKSSPLVKAGGSIDIKVDVTNNSENPAGRIYAITKSDNPIFDDKEFVFGNIPSGLTKTWTNKFEVPKWALSRDDEVEFIFHGANEQVINTQSISVVTKQLPRPEFAFNYEFIDDGSMGTRGNGNGTPEPEEISGLRIQIKNTGNGPSDDLTLLLKNDNSQEVNLKKGRIPLEKVAPNEVKEGTFLFSIVNPVEKLELEFQIVDETYREGVINKINLSIPPVPQQISASTKTYITNSENVPVLGSIMDMNSTIALAANNSVLQAVSENGEWVRAKLDDKTTGWINKEYLQLSDDKESKEIASAVTPVFQQSPHIVLNELPLVTKSNLLSIKGKIEDTDRVKLISVFIGEDKVLLKNYYGENAVIDSKINLKKGMNYINIFAKDIKGHISKKTYTVRYDA